MHFATEQPVDKWWRLIVRAESCEPIGCRWTGSVLDVRNAVKNASSETIITWSGTLGDSLFEPHIRNCLSVGQSAFRDALSRIADSLAQTKRRLLFRPHASHFLSDVPSCIAFLDEYDDELFGVALSPATMLTRQMLASAGDHLMRMFEHLGHRVRIVYLADVEAASDDVPKSCPLGTGILPHGLIAQLLRDHCPPDVNVILSKERFNEQCELFM